MSKTFMRGLALLELVDLYGPLTITELAKRSGVEKSIVSRTITACERDGWVVRSQAKIELGPRAALLGHSSPAAAAVRQAEPLVHALAGVTGLMAQAYALVGTRAVLIAAAGAGGSSFPAGLGTGLPLFATAAGKMVAAQLPEDELERLLPREPFPDAAAELTSLADFGSFSSVLPLAQGPLEASAGVARGRRALAEQLDAIRNDGLARDAGELHPELGCVAVAWPRTDGIPATLACMGSPAELAAEDALVRTVLTAASHPGATREDIVESAAGVMQSRPALAARAASV